MNYVDLAGEDEEEGGREEEEEGRRKRSILGSPEKVEKGRRNNDQKEGKKGKSKRKREREKEKKKKQVKSVLGTRQEDKVTSHGSWRRIMKTSCPVSTNERTTINQSIPGTKIDEGRKRKAKE